MSRSCFSRLGNLPLVCNFVETNKKNLFSVTIILPIRIITTMETKTPAIMATFGPSLFDISSVVGSALGFCVGSVRKIDNQIIAIFAIDFP